MKNKIIKEAKIINDGKIFEADLLIENQIISKIDKNIPNPNNYQEISAKGKYLIPGIIDDQVHFRDPGMTHKANIYTEAKAAVSGGVTSFMDMPNTIPNSLTLDILEEKYNNASINSLANYSFYMGTSNDNIDEILKIDPSSICGIKIFMGSSTGNMLVDNENALERFFGESPVLVAIHSEEEYIVQSNLKKAIEQYGENIPIYAHPEIRSIEACLKCTERAVDIANKTNGRLHILHLTTEDELKYFRNDIPIEEKRITAEVCAHHLYFDSEDYKNYGSLIKCNPAIKEPKHRKALFQAMLDGRLDIIATDHAPHTWQEKQNTYLKSPSGVPLVQHSLNIMLEFYHKGEITLEKIIQKMCHDPARLFQINDRGFVKEGFKADLALLDLEHQWEVNKFNLNYKCAWSPFEGHTFKGKITDTFVNGHHAYKNGSFDESQKGQRLQFNR